MSQISLIDQIVYNIIYFLLMIGIWFILGPMLIKIFKKRSTIKRLRNTLIEQKSEKEIINNKAFGYLRMLIHTTININSNFSVFTFLILSVAVFILAFSFVQLTGLNLLTQLIIALFFGLLPFIFLQQRIHTIRIEGSYDAEKVITSLINFYKMNHFNMVEAIDSAIPTLKEQPYSQKALFNLSLGLKRYRTEDELNELLAEFTFTLDANWARLLANNIYLAVHYGDGVEEALNDILTEIRAIKDSLEKNKRFNTEAFLFIKYLSPLSFVFSVYALFQFFGFTVDKYISYQFNNANAAMMFTLSMIMIVGNFIIYFYVKKPKFDL